MPRSPQKTPSQTETVQPPSEHPIETASVQDMMKEHLALSQSLFAQNQKILRYLKWMAFTNTLKFFLILIPLIIGLIYLPPVFKNVWEQYQSFVGLGTGTTFDVSSISELIKQFNN